MAAGDKGAAETFDPGVETGYLRRARRDRELPLEKGAAPFDPGPGVGYDTKRARRWAKDREHDTSGPAAREESAELVGLLVERDEQTAEDRELEDERKRALRDREAELRRERLARDREEREARRDREREELESVARLKEEERERERLERLDREERQREERRREELERRAELQEERELALREERERRQTDRARRQQEWQRRRQAVEGKRRRRAERKAAKVAAARRRRAKTQLALSRGHAGETGARPSRRSATATHPQERRPKPIRKRELAAPTAKAGVALATAAVAATFIASALGLPVPGLGSDENLVASLTGAAAPDSGSPIALTAGPYFPVVLDGPADYAEAAARFGANRGGRKHEGQDIFAKPGTPLVAVRDGIVIDGGGGKSFYSYGGGNSLVIYSPLDDRSYVYLHMLKPATVQAGDTVNAGQPVGQLGCTGSCDGPHLHFEVRRGRVAYGVDTKPLDPMPLLQQWPQVGRE